MNADNRWMTVIKAIEADVNGFIGGSIVDLDSGMTLASYSRRPDFDLEMASAYNSEMVKFKVKTMRSLNITSDLEDMLLTLGDQLHLIKMVSPTTFLYLAASRADTNLAILRSVVTQNTKDLVST